MITAYIEEGHQGRSIIIEDEDEHGPLQREIPLAAIASRRELLGIDDPVEVLKALIHVQKHGEPEPDPITGQNVWTDPYTILREREIAREEAALLAEEQGEPVVQVAAAAAYAKVHEPIAGGDCVLNRCRADACKALGVPVPDQKCREETRTQACEIPKPRAVAFGPMTQADHDESLLVGILQGEEQELLEATQRFLHSLTDNDRDPVTPHSEPDAPDTLEDLMAHYQQEAAIA